MKINIKKLTPNAIIPTRAHDTDAGWDLYTNEEVILAAGETKAIGTGIQIETPVGYYFQVVPRSGISLKSHLEIVNSPGTIDADYRGEIKIIARNTSLFQQNTGHTTSISTGGQMMSTSFKDRHGLDDASWGETFEVVDIARLDDATSNKHTRHLIPEGARIAQLILRKVEDFEWNEVEDVSETERGETGFGASGAK